MRVLGGLIVAAALAGLCGCADPEATQVAPATYKVTAPDWWPIDSQGGAEAGLDYAALGVCPQGYTKLDQHDAWDASTWDVPPDTAWDPTTWTLPWGKLTWTIRCNVPRA